MPPLEIPSSPENRTVTPPLSEMSDPTTQYFQGPYEPQAQPWPGLVKDMKPRPDHGETTYVGSGRLNGRKALITGGDSGIGRAAAIAYAREGADVTINYHPDEEPDALEVVALIEEAGRKAIAIPGDLRSEEFCKSLVARAVSDMGGLDILVNNAAMQRCVESLEEVTTEQFDDTFKVNVYAPFWITKAALAHLGPGASIIFTSSVQATSPSPNLVDYAQTKACNLNFARGLAKQLAARGIRVNAVAPGPFWTPLQVTGGQKPEDHESFGQESPLGRAGQPVELAPLYVMLASQESSYATGQLYGAEGGMAIS